MTPKLPPVFVISLARETTRRKNITRRLNALGATYQIIDATDGKTLNPQQYAHRLQTREWFLKFGGRQLKPGEVGCFISHHNLWQQIAEGEDEYALILEDDAVWDDDFADVINGVLTCEWHWEVVLLSVITTTTAGRVLCDIGDKRKLFHSYRYVLGTGAYLVSRTGAAKLHDYCQTIRKPLDWMVSEFWRHGAACYCVIPAPAGQSGEESSIGYDNPFQSRTPTQHILGSLLRKTDRLQRTIYLLTHHPQEK